MRRSDPGGWRKATIYVSSSVEWLQLQCGLYDDPRRFYVGRDVYLRGVVVRSFVRSFVRVFYGIRVACVV